MKKNADYMNIYSEPYNYPYCSFDFTEWNPVQKKCMPFFTEDCNIVVNSSTASGKTVIAEAVIGYELSRSDSSKAIYVSPLRAIGEEKYNSWKSHSTFSKYPMMLVSSDSNYRKSDFDSSRMIISTIESMNLRLRARDRWVSDAAVLVFDETHLLDDKSRGAGSEAMVMNMTMLNPSCRVICLSGTISNYIEIAKWLKSCNGKKTRFVNSAWRPTSLIKKIEISDDFDNDFSLILDYSRDAVENDIKMMVFVHSKKTGEEICRRLRDYGIITAFYHSGINNAKKSMIISEFRNLYSGMNILVCTSSLGMGVTI